jgi:hypothetical protein
MEPIGPTNNQRSEPSIVSTVRGGEDRALRLGLKGVEHGRTDHLEARKFLLGEFRVRGGSLRLPAME